MFSFFSTDSAVATARNAAQQLPEDAKVSEYSGQAASLLLAVEAGYLTAGEDGEIDENEYEVLAGALADLLGVDDEDVEEMFDSFDEAYDRDGYDARLAAIASGATGDMQQVALAMSASAALASGITDAAGSKTYTDLARAFGVSSQADGFFQQFAAQARASAS